MKRLNVDLGQRSYPILAGQGVLAELPALLDTLQVRGAVALVTDSNVAPLHAEPVEVLLKKAGRPVTRCTLPAGEANKTLAQIERLCGEFLEAGLDRAGMVVTLGGGVPGDIAGFAAASFMRGVSFVQVPTTILAQVDSSVGGKTGVNHPLGKNIIGAFHQPSGVVIDFTLLKTLPDRELRAGLAEIIKHGVIADESLFAYMEEHAGRILAKDLDAIEFPVVRSCEIKSAVVAADEREHGVRANLNYGHTFGHGIEAATHYTRYLHGEAVALGMRAAGALSLELGLVDEAFCARQDACIRAYGLPTSCPDLPVDEVLTAMRRDKKARAGTLKFVAPTRIGEVVHRTDITPEQARRAVESLRSDERIA